MDINNEEDVARICNWRYSKKRKKIEKIRPLKEGESNKIFSTIIDQAFDQYYERLGYSNTEEARGIFWGEVVRIKNRLKRERIKQKEEEFHSTQPENDNKIDYEMFAIGKKRRNFKYQYNHPKEGSGGIFIQMQILEEGLNPDSY